MVSENKFAPCEENSFKKGENLTFLSVKRARKDYFKSFSYSKLPSNISTMSSIFFECKEVSLPPHIFIGKVRFTAYSISCKNDYLPNIWRIFGVNRFLDIRRFFRILTYFVVYFLSKLPVQFISSLYSVFFCWCYGQAEKFPFPLWFYIYIYIS